MKLCYNLLDNMQIKIKLFYEQFDNATSKQILYNMPTTYCTRWSKVILIIKLVLWILQYMNNKCIMYIYIYTTL